MVTPAAIEQRYNHILRHNMEGIAVVNQHLQVKAVGFHPLGDELLGVLITPWFMNLMLLPADPESWGVSQQGTKSLRQLPSGPYEFIFGWDPDLGGYGMCALFSPMFEFKSQEQAEATAEEVVKALFDGENYAPTDRQREQIKEQLKEQSEQELKSQKFNSQLAPGSVVDSGSTTTAVAGAVQQEMGEPAQLSRRQFLTGMRKQEQATKNA